MRNQGAANRRQRRGRHQAVGACRQLWFRIRPPSPCGVLDIAVRTRVRVRMSEGLDERLVERSHMVLRLRVMRLGRRWWRLRLAGNGAATFGRIRSSSGPRDRTRWPAISPFFASGELNQDISQAVPLVSVKVPFDLEVLAQLGELLVPPFQLAAFVFQLLQLLVLLFLPLLLPLSESGRGPCVTLPLLVCLSRSLMDINRNHDFLPVRRRNGEKGLSFCHLKVSCRTRRHRSHIPGAPAALS